MLRNSFIAFVLFFGQLCCVEAQTEKPISSNYQDLVQLFKDWRNFEVPPLRNGAPDYTQATFDKRWPGFEELRTRLTALDTSGWQVNEKVDWYIVWAEMNGYEFNHKILKPWQRDPAYYKTLWMGRSDVPAHEGPTNHATVEIWTYEFPLSNFDKQKLLGELRVIPALNEQAKLNLTGNAKELFTAGIRDIKTQAKNLQTISTWRGIASENDLLAAIDEAIASTEDLVAWLEKEAPKKTGPSGIGKDNYSWYLQNVHLVPMTWEDEVMLLKTELSRAWTALKLEEHRNRDLPPLLPVDSPEAYDALAEKSAESLLNFLEKDEIVTVKEYFEPALKTHLGSFTPEETRNFFAITAHHDPRPLFSHFYHWFELARMDTEPHQSEIRKGPLLYNIYDSRNEGTATAVEEMFMHAGLYEDSPRSREIVYIMIAQRAARGLGSLHAHANELTMEEAGGIHSEYTPRGWMKTERQLLLFEQHLYLRQPGYGTSYITGKHLLNAAMADFAKMKENQGKEFKLKEFFDTINSMGNIPISLGHWQMTGVDKHLEKLAGQ